MIVNSTEVQNNFGKYLMLSADEDIIITRNGLPVAKLSAFKDEKSPVGCSHSMVKEGAPSYLVRQKATYEEFVELTKNTEARYEYIDGQIYQIASPKIPHQAVVTEFIVHFYASLVGTECRVFTAPCDISLQRPNGQISVVQPDVIIICDLDEHLADDGYYTGVPTLLVEILSESTSRIDLVKKYDLYMSCGVKEYWVVDPEEQLVFVHSFQDGAPDKPMVYRPPGEARSQVFPDLVVDLARGFR
jgi:prevent-host-death family protein